MKSIEISNEIFVSYFKENIRVMFDWRRMKQEKWKVDLGIIKERKKLNHLYTPWYLDEKNKEVNYKNLKGNPISLSDIPDKLAYFNRERIKLISQLSKSYEASRHPLQLFVPVYKVNKETSVLLDGNHRIAALMLSKAPFNLMVFTVKGPIDSNVLPDLFYWEAKRSDKI